MEFVTGDGIAAKSGGRVVKNVSGYDIHKMMIGALGTLGIITRINFRTFPLPRPARTCVITFRGSIAACEFRHAIARSTLRPLSIELVAASLGCPPELGRRAAIPFENNRWSVVVSFVGDEAVLDRTRRELQAMSRGIDGGSLESFTELREKAAENASRHISDLPAAILELSPAAAIFKIASLPTDLALLAAGIQTIEVPWLVFMRSLGVTYLALLPPDRTETSVASLKRACSRVFSLSGKAPWGRSVLLWCPPELKNEINIWGAASGDFPLMQELKNVFDPSGILSPGRFMGRL
jgi:glycolate oxidase FAD binding subunit